MRLPVATSFENGSSGGTFARIVGHGVVQCIPADTQPSASVGGPWAGLPGVVSEAHDGGAQPIVARPLPTDATRSPALLADRRDAGLGDEVILDLEAGARIAQFGGELSAHQRPQDLDFWPERRQSVAVWAQDDGKDVGVAKVALGGHGEVVGPACIDSIGMNRREDEPVLDQQGNPHEVLSNRRSGRILVEVAHLPLARLERPATSSPQVSFEASRSEQTWRSLRRRGPSAQTILKMIQRHREVA